MRRSPQSCALLPVPTLALLLFAGSSMTAAALSAAVGDPPPPPAPHSSPGPAAEPQQEQQGAGDAAATGLARGGAFTASVEMVRVPVIVVDGEGSFVRDLTPDDFAVRDGRREHSVNHFVSDAAPVIVGVLIDASVEMRPWAHDLRIAVERIARNLRAEDQLFLIGYGNRVTTLQTPTADKDALLAALAEYSAPDDPGRALYDAIGQGLNALRSSPIEKRSLIVIGGGADTSSDLGELAARQLIGRAGVTIHTIAMKPRPAAAAAPRQGRFETLSEIAAFTAGFVARRPLLPARYGDSAGWSATAAHDISTYLKHQYLLHYAPQDPPRPGTWRSIRVHVVGNYREIRARSGYTR